MQRKFGYLQIFPKADDKRCDQTVTKVVRRKFVEKPQSKRNGKDGVLRHANLFFIKEDSMKKKLTMFLSVLMAFLLTFSFAACDKKGEDGEKEIIDIAGNLCTSLDVMAEGITLPVVETGDIVAVTNAGSYGLTLSPATFSSHRPPKEFLL